MSPTPQESASLLNQVRKLTASPAISPNAISQFVATTQGVSFNLSQTTGISTVDLLVSPYADLGGVAIAQTWNAQDNPGGFSYSPATYSPSGKLYYWVRLNPQGTSGTAVTSDSQSISVVKATMAPVVNRTVVNSGITRTSNINGVAQTYPDGTVRMFGISAAGSPTGVARTSFVVPFPIAFATAPLSVQVNPTNHPDTPYGIAVFSCYATNITTTGFTVNLAAGVTIGGSGPANITNAVKVCWEASA